MSKQRTNISVEQILNTPAGKLNQHLQPSGKSGELKKSKYKNVRIETEDGVFDSKRERKEYIKLKLRERAGEIFGISRQRRFLLPGNIVYLADFTFFEVSNGIAAEFMDGSKLNGERKDYIVMDAKGARTDAYIMKKKLMKERYNIDIVEV